MASPRIYVLPAAHAAQALVVRRGPTRWWHLLEWNLEKPALRSGAWLKGTLYPRRCGLSPDGKIFGYFVHKQRQDRSWPDSYFAVSKAPWFRALAAWETVGTWTGGCQFDDHGNLIVEAAMNAKPFVGSFPKRVIYRGLDTNWLRRDIANELSRGWTLWDIEEDERIFDIPLKQTPALLLSAANPQVPSSELVLAHRGTDFTRPAMEGAQLTYLLRDSRTESFRTLRGVQWADWAADGRLLTARTNGFLEIHEPCDSEWICTWKADLSEMKPNPEPAPDSAQHW